MRNLALLAVTSLASHFALEVSADDPASRPSAGTQLAFVREDQIYLINADGTGLTQLTDTGEGVENAHPAWSPDGQRLAFARRNEDGPSSIYIMGPDGWNEGQLTSLGSGAEPAWGPDGRIVFLSDGVSGNAALAVIDPDADGSPESSILLDRPGYIAQPAWSPDGQTITFTTDSFQAYDFHYDLGAMNADGSNVRPLLKGPFFWVDGLTFYFQSAWSPDGQSIAVVVCRGGSDVCYPKSEIAVVNSDGSGLRTIAQAGSYARPTWSPDGRWIAYGSSLCPACQSSIKFMNVDGGIEGLVVDNGHSPAWRPESGARIDVGHSGAWFNPATSGQGQFLEVEPDEQFVFLGWFTYTDVESGSPGEQHWFTAEGHYSGSKAELILYESVGGKFDHPQAVTTTPVGEATLTFSDCGHGTMSYRFDDRDLEGSFPMIRAIPGSSNICESRAGATTQAVTVNPGMDGAWSDPDASGQGFFLDVHAPEDDAGFIFVSWFTYGDDTSSGLRWLTAEGQFEGSRADLVIYDTQGGSFDDPQPAESIPVGSMSIDFSDCANAQLSYSLDAEHVAGEMALSRLIPNGQALCEELSALD